MAVAPMLILHSTFWMRSSARTSPPSVAAKASNSWPSVMGTASWSCVRPIFRIAANSFPLPRNAAIELLDLRDEPTLPSAMPMWSEEG